MGEVRIQPSVWQSETVSNMVNRVLHNGYGRKHSVNVCGHFAESIAFNDGSPTNQNDFHWHLSAAQSLVFLGKLIEVHIQILFGEHLVILS